MTPEELTFRGHIAVCLKCKIANKRVNDFCPTGLMLFQQCNFEIVDVKPLSQEASDRVVEEYKHKAKIHNNN